MLAPPRSLEETLDWLRKTFQAAAASDLAISYQIVLTGDEPESFWVDVRNGRLDLGRGKLASPDVTFRIGAADFLGVLAGSENPDLLFMEERLEIEGELALALKLRLLFRTPA